MKPARKGFKRRLIPREVRRGVCAGVDLTAKDCGDKVRTLRKVAIKSAETDTCPRGDLPYWSVYARGDENLFRREKQRVEAALRIGTHPAFRTGDRLVILATIFPRLRHHISACKSDQ